MFIHFIIEVFHRDVAYFGDFVYVQFYITTETAGKNMIEFVLPKILPHICFIDKMKFLAQFRINPELFTHASVGTFKIRFVYSGMRAYGVRPLVWRMVFSGSSFLQQHFARFIKKENRKRTVKDALLMRLHFFHHA